jgi:hypothetical protein
MLQQNGFKTSKIYVYNVNIYVKNQMRWQCQNLRKKNGGCDVNNNVNRSQKPQLKHPGPFVEEGAWSNIYP